MPAELRNPIHLTFNAEKVETSNFILQFFLAEQGWQQGRFVVLINDSIIAKSDYASYQLSTGDRIDVLSPISGG